MDLCIILYIDNGVCASASVAKLIEDRCVITFDVEKAGFTSNIPKSQLEPHEIADWLGFVIDLCAGCFKVSADKLDKLKVAIHNIAMQDN